MINHCTNLAAAAATTTTTLLNMPRIGLGSLGQTLPEYYPNLYSDRQLTEAKRQPNLHFDSSNTACLVAFDGIPVEVGKWTFESIRKSILARGRPMTLSFRNDFLTPKQQTILTKAVEAVNSPSTTASVPEIHSTCVSTTGGRTDTKASTGYENTIGRSTSSISSQRLSQPKSKYYSFSEARSSILSAVAPLVSNLLSNSLNASSVMNRQDEQFAPSYVKRPSDSLEEMRHHHDFQSGLL